MEEIRLDLSELINVVKSKLNKDGVLPDPNLLQFYTDLANRRITWNDDVTEDILGLADYIIQWNEEDKDIEVEKRKPIKIFINTSGGDSGATMCLIDVIEASKTPVYTIGLDRCYSAGGYILMAGHKRMIFKNTSFLLHDGFTDIGGSIGKFADTAAFIEKQEDYVRDFVTRRTKITEEEYLKNYRRDWFMFSDDIIKYGVADKIITDISEVF